MAKREEIAEIRDSARIAGLMPYIFENLQKQQSSVINKAAQAAADGSLSQEKAQALWFELLACRSLQRKFEQMARRTSSLVAKHGDELDF